MGVGKNSARLVVIALALGLSAGCGSSSHPKATCTRPATTAPEYRVSIDLNGDGTPETVRYTTLDAAGCQVGPRLSTTVGDQQLSVGFTPQGELSASSLAPVRVPGRTGDLLMVTATQPRGGFDVHLFGFADGSMAELRDAGKPLIGFTATDVMTTPVSASCTTNGLIVTRARLDATRKPPVWKVTRTSYRLDGTTLTKASTSNLGTVAQAALEQRFPELTGYRILTDCR